MPKAPAVKAINRVKDLTGNNGKSEATKKGIIEASITPPNLVIGHFLIRGTSDYVQNAFPAKARQQMHDTQEAGSQSKKGKKREPKDFQRAFEEATHRAADGSYGLPAGGLRSAMISACRLVGFKMTHAKLAMWIEADTVDALYETPLVKITKGKPIYFEQPLANANGSYDLRARPMFKAGWEAVVRVCFDADIFSPQDILNLLARAGRQIGIGAGRNDSTNCAGCGWGSFDVISTATEEK